ncbi:MAG: type III pantothenate kinase [Cyanobacteria bacterium SIG26]|nr:type III pantothenate kinase [Cyanobacteria bacterium SIG26]
MLLMADIGNTNITLGLFEGDNYINEFRLASDRDLSKDEYEVLLKSLLKDFVIKGCVIASVVEELNVKFKSAIDNVLGVESIFVDNSINLNVMIKTDNPTEVGADRIANAVAVAKDYDGAVIVIDFGTATSFDVVNSKKEFLGGVIAPGINTQMKCLNKATSKLPKIDVAISHNAIGHNTTDAILSGVIRGTACMVDGLVEQCEAELDEKATIVATGGYCGLIANYLKRPFDSINPILTLQGLKYIYEMNSSKELNIVSKLQEVTH